ncbi:hypothetical protein GCM10010109_68660 [Actinoplanes campanulatus]|nr:hypothetical protein GCM10010109_68660 [Actinoplanes campanulatus]GID42371.1 hypothetical protein Aca09nite_88770 [Actinoplanes campanulatus]
MFTAVAPSFDEAVAGDSALDLALMWQAVADGWLPPDTVTEDEYRAMRHADPSPLRAFVGFGCSFGGRWFQGYARSSGRNYPAECHRRIRHMAPAFRGRSVHCRDYRYWRVDANTVVYCDPPYADTTPYAGSPRFNSDEFWWVAERWARSGALVLVSEYTAPTGWRSVWSKARRVTMRVDDNSSIATEHLWMLGDPDDRLVRAEPAMSRPSFPASV